MKTTQTFSILIWANNARISSKGLPLYARVTIDGKRAEISLKKRVPSEEKWDSKACCVVGKSEKAKDINSYLTHVKSELEKIYNQMQVLDEHITAETLKLWFTGGKEEIKTLMQVVNYHNEQMSKTIGIDVVKITFAKYKCLHDKLVKFLKYQYKKSDFLLTDLNHKFVTNFEYYLKAHLKNAHNTAMKDIKNLKKVVNMAIQNDWLDKNPFTTFKCTYKKVEREVLTDEEMEVVENKEFKIERVRLVRDLFIFSCYTGLAYADVMKLTPKNIVRGIDGEYWIYTSRKKTDESVRIPILPKAFAIIEAYKSHPSVVNSGLLLPHFSNQKLNSYLKEIADVCKIEKNLTFHLARHTFATTITLSNGVPIETVSKLLGHSSIKITQIYAKVVERKVSEDMSILKSKLTNLPNRKASNF
jgi:site-specific recombinase XerD